MEYSSTKSEALDKFLLFLLIVSSIGLPLAIFYFLMFDYNSACAIYSTVALNLVYLLIDGLLAWRHPNVDRQRGYQEAFLLADIPIVLSNLGFLAWLQFHQEANWSIFASGMVGFQLVSCNIIFVITQTGIVRAIWIRDGLRATA